MITKIKKIKIIGISLILVLSIICVSLTGAGDNSPDYSVSSGSLSLIDYPIDKPNVWEKEGVIYARLDDKECTIKLNSEAKITFEEKSQSTEFSYTLDKDENFAPEITVECNGNVTFVRNKLLLGNLGIDFSTLERRVNILDYAPELVSKELLDSYKSVKTGGVSLAELEEAAGQKLKVAFDVSKEKISDNSFVIRPSLKEGYDFKTGDVIVLDPVIEITDLSISEDGYIYRDAYLDYSRYNNEDLHAEVVGIPLYETEVNELFRSYIEFNVSDIPDTATINSVNLKIYVTDTSGDRNCDVGDVYGERPTTASDTDVHDGINSGKGRYLSNDDFCTTTGWRELDLGSTAVSDLDSALSNNWFAVGIMLNSEDCEEWENFYSYFDSVEGSNPPELIVNYSGGAITVSVDYPANESYVDVNVSAINYTVNADNGGDSCWYSNNSGVWNSSAVVAGENFTNVISEEGSNTWTVYCNETISNENSSSVTFFKYTSILQPGNVDHCGNITQSGTYTLLNNLNSNEDCIIVDSDNVTFDAADYSITTNNDYVGIYSNKDHTTVKTDSIGLSMPYSGGFGLNIDGSNLIFKKN